MKFLVSTSTTGDGSIYIQNCTIGIETQVELLFGTFRLQNSSNRKVFIATGTGLAPFLPRFAVMDAHRQLNSAELLFGCRLIEESSQALYRLSRTTACVSADPLVPGVFHGRVTKALTELNFDPATTDFYICGSPAMLNDCRVLLVNAGATRILLEPY